MPVNSKSEIISELGMRKRKVRLVLKETVGTSSGGILRQRRIYQRFYCEDPWSQDDFPGNVD